MIPFVPPISIPIDGGVLRKISAVALLAAIVVVLLLLSLLTK